MLLDSGVVKICRIDSQTNQGGMPREKLVPISSHFYGERTVGYSRMYAAMGVNEQVDMLIRIWEDRSVRAGMVALLESGEQYRINGVQQITDEDGLKVTDLSLARLGANYDIAD